MNKYTPSIEELIEEIAECAICARFSKAGSEGEKYFLEKYLKARKTIIRRFNATKKTRKEVKK